MTRWRGRLGSFVVVIVTLMVAPSAVRDASAQATPEASSPRSRKPATAARGQQVYAQHCAFCHGADARGGAQGGADLLQSPIVLDDEGGAGLAKFLAVGRPEKNMPKFTLPRPRVAEIAAFLHARIAAASSTSSRVKVDILVGDPKAGEAYFNGPGRCTSCHSVTGDLAGIAKKYDHVNLQGRMIVPRGRGGYPGGENERDLPLRATVTLASGEIVKGDVLYLSDFHLAVKDASGKRHTFTRRGDEPKVEIVDPLHAHIALLRTLSDASMHDLTAYLATLK